ncbi:MAG: cysteine hydrolase family protein [Actinomycetota bacterium]
MVSSALVIVDVQNDYFTDGKFPLQGMAAAAERAQRALEHARSSQLAVFHVRHEIPVEGAPFFEPGTAGAEIHHLVAPDGDEPVVTKHYPNSFRETSLERQLRDATIDEVVVVGAQSNMCIDATARAANDLGFKVRVLHDACAAKEQRFDGVEIPADTVHRTFMAALVPAYATVTTTEQFIDGSTGN